MDFQEAFRAAKVACIHARYHLPRQPKYSIHCCISLCIQIPISEGRVVRPIPMGSEQPCTRFPSANRNERAYPFPDDLALLGYLKDPTTCSFADKHIIVGLSLGSRDMAAEELLLRLGGVKPCNAAVFQIHFNYTREGHPVAMHPVIEYLYIAIR